MPKKSDSEFTLRNCKFGYQCPSRWEDLAPTKKAGVQFCGKCDSKVYFCETDSELRDAVENNRCVALWRGRRRKRGEFLLGYIDPPEL